MRPLAIEGRGYILGSVTIRNGFADFYRATIRGGKSDCTKLHDLQAD